MKTLIPTALIAALSMSAFAQPRQEDPSAHQPAAAASVIGMSDGEIRKVDKEAKKLTIKHGEIKNLDMPPMTMVFRVEDPAMLDKVKPGDKVRFAARKSDAGYVVTDLVPAP